MYIAVTYIGGKYVPGEVIDDDMPKENLEWLIQSGAVRKAAPAPSDADDSGSEIEHNANAAQGQGADEALDPEVMDDEAEEIDEERKVNLPEADLSPAFAGDGSGDIEDIDFAAEAPEIDVMAGIVKDEPEAAEKPAPKARNAGKKAPKGGKTK